MKSDCIINGIEAEADGEEGLNDVRAMRAIEAAAYSGKAQEILNKPRPRHPTRDMKRHFPVTTRRLLV